MVCAKCSANIAQPSFYSGFLVVSLQILHFVPLCSWWKKISIVQSVCQEDFPLQRIFWQQCDNCFIEQIRIYLCTYSLVILVRTSFSKLVFESWPIYHVTYISQAQKKINAVTSWANTQNDNYLTQTCFQHKCLFFWLHICGYYCTSA